MANVFGNPVTDSTLQVMPEYIGKRITAVDRARVAIKMINANSKDVNALTYVTNLKSQWGVGVSTHCMVYNATGYTMTYSDHKDWYGHIGPAPYPAQIQNGQWGAFLHVKTSGAASGSNAAVVYRGKYGNEGEDCEYMMAWSNPWSRASYDNSVWAESAPTGYFRINWDVIYGLLHQTRYNHTDLWNGSLSTISTGSYTSPVVKATFTLDLKDQLESAPYETNEIQHKPTNPEPSEDRIRNGNTHMIDVTIS